MESFSWHPQPHSSFNSLHPQIHYHHPLKILSKMKAFAVLAFCAASVAATQYGQTRMESSYSAPQQRTDSYGSSYGSAMRSEIPITRFNQDIRGSQSNNVQYETGNGISMSDDTQVIRGSGSSYDDGYGNMVRSDSVVHKQGNYAYTSPEGQQIRTSWTADENGFRAQGDHLPRPVEMPAEHAEAHREALSRASSSSYGSSSYEAPAMRDSYSAPAPAIRVQTYEAPAVRSSYSAPAPAIRTQSYEAPMRNSGY